MKTQKSLIFVYCFISLIACSELEGVNKIQKTIDDQGTKKAEFTPQAIILNWQSVYEDELGKAVHQHEVENYIIHWGRDQSSLNNTIIINPAFDSYQFTAQAAGDYYFAISVESIYGTHSQASNIVYKQVN